jgi:hypothetical protein
MRIAFDSLEAKDKKKDEKATRKVKLSFRSSVTSTQRDKVVGGAPQIQVPGVGGFHFFFQNEPPLEHSLPSGQC